MCTTSRNIEERSVGVGVGEGERKEREGGEEGGGRVGGKEVEE